MYLEEFNTQDYRIETNNNRYYVIVNKNTNVEEYFDSRLPKILTKIVKLQLGLNSSKSTFKNFIDTNNDSIRRIDLDKPIKLRNSDDEFKIYAFDININGPYKIIGAIKNDSGEWDLRTWDQDGYHFQDDYDLVNY